jgi:hypothetical protein
MNATKICRLNKSKDEEYIQIFITPSHTINGLCTEKSTEKAVTTQTFFRNSISRDRILNNFLVNDGSHAYIFKT